MNNFLAGDTNDIEDTPKEGVDQHKKRDALKDAISQGKAHLLGGGKKPWTFERIDAMKDEAINKVYYEYNQRDIQQKAQTTGRAVSKHVVNLWSTGVNRFFPVRVEQLKQDIKEDIIIQDQMADLGRFLMATLGPFLAPVLIAAHTLNNVKGVESNNEKGSSGDADNKGYKSNKDDETKLIF